MGRVVRVEVCLGCLGDERGKALAFGCVNAEMTSARKAKLERLYEFASRNTICRR